MAKMGMRYKTLTTAPISGGRVLIVDDEASIRSSYTNALTDAGFEVVEAKGGKEALQRIEKDRFDLVITDIHMPRMDGLTLLRHVHALVPDVPVVLMLEGPNDLIAIQAAELGPLQSLLKPIDHNLLKRTAALAIRLSRLRQSPAPEIRNRRGETPAKISATETKNKLGEVLDRVIQGGMVLITKHETPKAVLLSMDEYGALSRATQTRLDTLNGEFDALLARMQTAKARAGMKAAFNASPKQLGKAALAVARKRD